MLAGFKSTAYNFFWPKLLAPFLSISVYHFCSYFVLVGIVGPGSLD